MVDLAHDAGVPLEKIGRIERGDGEGKPSTHLRLAEALGVSLDEYFGRGLAEASKKEPERITSDSSATVEQLASLPGVEMSIKRIHLLPHKSLLTAKYLIPKRPVFFYALQGDLTLQAEKEADVSKPSEYLGFSRPL